MERVPCQFKNTEACPVFRVQGECYEDTHHLFWPRRLFKAIKVARDFRELEENKVRICRNLHNLEHHVLPPPDVPDFEIMRMAVEEERNRRLNPEG